MKSEDKFKIAYFIGRSREIFVTEFGYSKRHAVKVAGPTMREFYVLHFELSGKSELGELDIEAAEAFILPKNQAHSFRTTEPSERYWICFGGDSAEELLKLFGIPNSSHARLSVSNPKELLISISRLFSLACEYENTYEGEAYALSALMSMLPRLAVVEESRRPISDDYVSLAIRYMQQNCQRNVKMQEVAARLCISEKHLCRLFVESLSLPPKAVFQKFRMDKAESLLLQTKLLISEIAASCGLSSASRFSAAFIKSHGISPTAFRKK